MEEQAAETRAATLPKIQQSLTDTIEDALYGARCAEAPGEQYWDHIRQAWGSLDATDRAEAVAAYAEGQACNVPCGLETLAEWFEGQDCWSCEDCDDATDAGGDLEAHLRDYGATYCVECIHARDTDQRDFERSHGPGYL